MTYHYDIRYSTAEGTKSSRMTLQNFSGLDLMNPAKVLTDDDYTCPYYLIPTI